MEKIRIGVPDFIAIRPLVFGLTRNMEPNAELIYDEPGLLAVAVERGALDGALVPTIEYLRGVGAGHIDGPALVARPSMGGIVLLAQKPIDALERVAVGEFNRSSVAVLRIVLGELHETFPDLCVAKDLHRDWRENYDGILLEGDDGLRRLSIRPDPGVTEYNVVDMWYSLTALPLVLGLWAYNDESLAGTLAKILIVSRNLGTQNLPRLAGGIAQTTGHDVDLLYSYLTNCWEYQLTDMGKESLKVFENYALRYDLIRESRLVPVAAK